MTMVDEANLSEALLRGSFEAVSGSVQSTSRAVGSVLGKQELRQILVEVTNQYGLSLGKGHGYDIYSNRIVGSRWVWSAILRELAANIQKYGLGSVSDEWGREDVRANHVVDWGVVGNGAGGIFFLRGSKKLSEHSGVDIGGMQNLKRFCKDCEDGKARTSNRRSFGLPLVKRLCDFASLRFQFCPCVAIPDQRMVDEWPVDWSEESGDFLPEVLCGAFRGTAILTYVIWWIDDSSARLGDV